MIFFNAKFRVWYESIFFNVSFSHFTVLQFIIFIFSIHLKFSFFIHFCCFFLAHTVFKLFKYSLNVFFKLYIDFYKLSWWLDFSLETENELKVKYFVIYSENLIRLSVQIVYRLCKLKLSLNIELSQINFYLAELGIG